MKVITPLKNFVRLNLPVNDPLRIFVLNEPDTLDEWVESPGNNGDWVTARVLYEQLEAQSS